MHKYLSPPQYGCIIILLYQGSLFMLLWHKSKLKHVVFYDYFFFLAQHFFPLGVNNCPDFYFLNFPCVYHWLNSESSHGYVDLFSKVWNTLSSLSVLISWRNLCSSAFYSSVNWLHHYCLGNSFHQPWDAFYQTWNPSNRRYSIWTIFWLGLEVSFTQNYELICTISF